MNANRLALIASVLLLFTLPVQAEVWIGMSKGEPLEELGLPAAQLAVGPKELYQYPEGRRVEVLDDRVTNLVGFPAEMIAVKKQASAETTPKASTAYAQEAPAPTTPRPFVNFEAVKAENKETFTLQAPESTFGDVDSFDIRKLLDPEKATTAYILGGALVACALIAWVVAVIRRKRAAERAKFKIGKADQDLPPFLKSTPIEKPSLLDPRGDTSELRAERLSARDDPTSMGLSIRGPIGEDYNPYGPRTQLVGNVNSPENNAAYAAAKKEANKPSRKRTPPSNVTRETQSPETEKKSGLKLRSE